jgi:hypothetical protein
MDFDMAGRSAERMRGRDSDKFGQLTERKITAPAVRLLTIRCVLTHAHLHQIPNRRAAFRLGHDEWVQACYGGTETQERADVG